MELKDIKQYKKFEDKKINPSHLSQILDSSMKVHTAGGVLSQHFIIIEKNKTKQKLKPYLLKQDWMLQAPIWVVICFEADEMQKYFKNKAELFCLQDTSSSSQNMILTANKLDINHYLVRSFKETELKETLKIPEDTKVSGILVLGKGKDQGEKYKRYNLKKHISFEEHGKEKTDKVFPLKKRS
tara:strand:- start:4538 stop:5089 length:552 start_codon:yes stop_codon:yes gene_type:complete